MSSMVFPAHHTSSPHIFGDVRWLPAVRRSQLQLPRFELNSSSSIAEARLNLSERVRRSFYSIAISSIFPSSSSARSLEDHSFHNSCKERLVSRGIYFFYLVFGKTVRLRHYPVTVSVESLAIDSKPLERKFWEGCPSSKKRKSGDRPDRIRA